MWVRLLPDDAFALRVSPPRDDLLDADYRRPSHVSWEGDLGCGRSLRAECGFEGNRGGGCCVWGGVCLLPTVCGFGERSVCCDRKRFGCCRDGVCCVECRSDTIAEALGWIAWGDPSPALRAPSPLERGEGTGLRGEGTGWRREGTGWRHEGAERGTAGFADVNNRHRGLRRSIFRCNPLFLGWLSNDVPCG